MPLSQNLELVLPHFTVHVPTKDSVEFYFEPILIGYNVIETV